ncbi:terpenoid synthase [Gautieria morchelliformis]|nr:terpenoid synthase [Gautieria morchelliformis]
MHRWACTFSKPASITSTTPRWAITRRQSTASHTAIRPPPADSQPRPQQLPSSSVDPYASLAPELAQLRHTLFHLLGSSHPSLTQIAKYYFLHPSKQLRPLLVLLFSRATNGLGADWRVKRWHADCEGAGGRAEELDMPLTRADVLNDWNPNMPDHTASFDVAFQLRAPRRPVPAPLPKPTPEERVPMLEGQILPTQIRLAQIVEMIHVASLLHDDVLDESPLRRGAPSAHVRYGNKLSVLAGDFLLGRASASLSRLGDSEVVELIATVVANLVEGEVMQINRVHGDELRRMDGVSRDSARSSVDAGSVRQEDWSIYLKKSYLKTASLMAKSARAAVILGGVLEGEVWKEVAYAYGRNIGIAFQLVDDVLDYEEGECTLGKPGGADLKLGLTTAPALYAWEEHEAMGPLIRRKFDQEGDIELARELVRRSSGVERTRDLARTHAEKAREALDLLPESDSKAALLALTERVVQRKW